MTLQDGQASLPTAHSTDSFWHSEPSKTLLGHRTTAQLPHTADVVVIGSGITGTFAARALAEGGRAVVMLEAREACWGATGRNGGHCQPAVWNNKPEVARFELETFGFLRDLVADNDIDCDWRLVGGVQVLTSQQELDMARQLVARLERHADLRDKAGVVDEAAALAALRVPDAAGAVYQPVAASCWPYKLVAWVLERLLRDHGRSGGFNLQTTTPATRLQRAATGQAAWVVHTPRGPVAAANVVLASNAYTSYLVPAMTGLIVPVRGQVAALRPPAGATPLTHSYVWLVEGTDDYLVQRPQLLVLGGERCAGAGGSEGVWRDDEVDPVVARRLRRALGLTLKLRPGPADEEAELEAAYEWTGIMGYSRDGHPWVGRVPDGLVADGPADGLWVSAGYMGHGMPLAARCGVAVADMMLGREDGAVVVPREFVPSEQRAEAARHMELPRDAMDVKRLRRLLVDD